MVEGQITDIYYEKDGFYIFRIVKDNYEQIALKGSLPVELADKIKIGNLAKTTGKKEWNKKYQNYEIKVNSDNLEINTLNTDEEDLEVLEGEVTSIVYKTDGFNVFKIDIRDFSCLSNVPVFIGTQLKMTGYFEKNKYGLNFNVVKIEELPFSSEKALIRFLSSKFFKGIGDHFATKIVDRFGLDTLDVLRNKPEKLTNISGIGDKRASNIIESFQEKMKIKEVIEFAVKHDITENMIFKLYEKYGKELINLLHQNPYLITELRGIGFKRADKIAQEIGIAKDSNYRINSFLTYYLENKAGGNTYLKLNDLIKSIEENLEIHNPADQILEAYFNFKAIEYVVKEDDKIETRKFTKDFILFVQNNLISLTKDREQKLDRICVATKKNYSQELEIYKKLKNINSNQPEINLTESEIERLIKDQQQRQEFKYTKKQRQILTNCLEKKLVVLTGKAGTGKSTVSKGLIDMYQENDNEVLNLAPTGKAAKRITEVTNKEAHTIHNACYNLSLRNYDVIMVDEAGMLSTSVAHLLLKYLKSDHTLVLIGDVAQIPPVQPGNIFRDIINMISDNFIEGLFIKLDEIKRQDISGNIAPICNKIAAGKKPLTMDYEDIKFIEKENEEILDYLKEIISYELEENQVDFNQLQVISPQYKGIVGINAINNMIQSEFNNNDYLIKNQYKQIKKHDKVMQTMNMKSLDIVNGDALEVLRVEEREKEETEISREGEPETEEVIICKLNNGLEERAIEYPKKEFLKYTTLAYCCSAHKMQGSEYPIVIYILSTSHYIMLNRNLLYTGLTRGQKRVYLIGQPKAFYISLDNEVNQSRNTILNLLNKNKLTNVNYST